MTFYCALGVYLLDKQTGQPVVVRRDQQYGLQFEEFVLWSSLLWNIYDYDELGTAYEQKFFHMGIQAKYPFDEVLQRLVLRGLVTQGSGETGIDSLYELLGNLFLVPIKNSAIERFKGFLHLTFFRNVPLRVTRHVFDNDCNLMSQSEKKIWKLSKQQILSTAELIRCEELDLKDVSNDGDIVQKLYSGMDHVDYANVLFHSRMSPKCQGVLEAVANLYLKKLVLFESVT